MDVFRRPLRFRFRLCGSSFVERIGLDLTGHDLSALPDQIYREKVRAEFERIVRTATPSISRNRRYVSGRGYDFEVLRLPLGEDGVRVTTLMICPMYFEPIPAQFGVGTGAEPRFEPPVCLD